MFATVSLKLGIAEERAQMKDPGSSPFPQGVASGLAFSRRSRRAA